MTQLAIGKPTPLGAHYDGQGVNFTLFSAHAERSCVSLMPMARNIAMTCQGTVATFGTVICRMRARVCVMVIEFMAPGNLPRGIALTRRSC